MRVLGAASQQLSAASDVVPYGGVALAAGVVLGLLAPRRLIRQYLGTPVWAPIRGVAVVPPAARADLAFAAALSAVLILVLAGLWTLLAGLATWLEDYRVVLNARFVHPPWLARLLLLAPFWLGVFLLGAIGTTVFAALEGWYRLVRRANPGAVNIWIVILAAGALGAGFGAMTGQAAVLNLVTLLASFGAGILAILRRPAPEVRVEIRHREQTRPGELLVPLLVGGLAVLGAWLAVVALRADGPIFAKDPASPPASPSSAGLAVGAARGLLRTPGLRTAFVRAGQAAPDAPLPNAWDIDLGGPRWDVLVLARSPTDGPEAQREPERVTRLLRRCARALLPGGRLVIELPADDLAQAAFRVLSAAVAPSEDGAYLYQLAQDSDRYEALIFGPDVPAWFGRRPQPPGFDVKLTAVHDLADLNRTRTTAVDPR